MKRKKSSTRSTVGQKDDLVGRGSPHLDIAMLFIIGRALVVGVRVKAHFLEQTVELLQRVEVERHSPLPLLTSKLQADLGTQMQRQSLFKVDHMWGWIDPTSGL